MSNTAFANISTTKHSIRNIIGFGLAEGYSIALWKLPNQNNINLLLSSRAKLIDDLTIEECAPGFAFAPFDNAKAKLFFEADHLFEISNKGVAEKTNKQLLDIIEKSQNNSKLQFHKSSTQIIPEPEDTYINLVKDCINAIEAGAFEKVVPSKQHALAVSDSFDMLDGFEKLTKKYPLAMVSLISDSTIGTWMGATPELLVSTDKKGIFRTVALAGTQSYLENISLKNISWTQKEIEEQALVERYIISCFKKIRVREYEEHGPKTVQAGNLLHLRSDFEVDMKEVNYPQLGSVMLKLLHPTSAVCGMPLESSFKFLQENENYNREFYSGFLGPVNIDHESYLFVNLRCLKWCGDKIILYAGAGVTIDSIPEQEEKEVQLKFETIRTALEI